MTQGTGWLLGPKKYMFWSQGSGEDIVVQRVKLPEKLSTVPLTSRTISV